MNQRLNIHYETRTFPPPYAYAYDLLMQWDEQTLDVQLTWQYTDRDELSEEEVLEEGFTVDDDFRWQGQLPSVWIPVLNTLLDATALSPVASAPRETLLTITTTDTREHTVRGTPDNFPQWEYSLQELVQAVYEASQREHPLRIRYHDRRSDSPANITIEASFLHRRLTSTLRQGAKTTTRDMPWQALHDLLEVLYLPDYDTEQSVAAQPEKPGHYVDPGDGRWYRLGSAVTNPGKKDSVSVIANWFGTM